MEKLEGIEMSDLTQKLLKAYCDETRDDPRAVLITALQGLLDRQKQNKALKGVLGDNMVTIQMMLFGRFVDFIRDYLSFFGDRQTLETFCMQAVYDKCNSLHRDLTEFVNNKTHGLDSHAWYEKHSHVAITSSAPEDESE